MKTIIRIVLNGVFIYLIAKFLPGVLVASIETGIIVALILAVLNAFVAPILHLLALPITLLTFGLFALVVNGAIILLADALMSSFNVSGWLMAIVFSIILAIFNFFLERIMPSED
ncbi:MAG: phage holin family protein [Cytophagales bacterium]|nr:phage holin family protein [Bernardetiaceae bacterium]MDW8211195.1 phage holin family protein [Cytophagales bacterium]